LISLAALSPTERATLRATGREVNGVRRKLASTPEPLGPRHWAIVVAATSRRRLLSATCVARVFS